MTQYPDRPPDSCTTNIGEVMSWRYTIPAGIEERLRSGTCYGEHSGGPYYGQFVWFEDGEFHVAVWRRKQWWETVHGKVLLDLLVESTRRLTGVRRARGEET